MLRINGFIWDKGNIAKVQKHGLKIEDIENFLESNPFVFPDTKDSPTETRFYAFDKAQDKLIFAVFTFRAAEGHLRIRVISARYAHKKEWKKFYGKI